MPTVVLTNGDDNYVPNFDEPVIYALDGNDWIRRGGAGGAGFIDGGAGNDILYNAITEGDTYTLYGGSGDDTLTGEVFGDHRIYGGDGNDFIYAFSSPMSGPSGNIVYGGEGNDSIQGIGTLLGDGGNDSIYYARNIFGGAGDDLIVVSNAGGTGYGGTGNDSVYGGSGPDILVGDHGIDLLVGNGGNDYLYMPTSGGQGYGGDGVDVGVGSSVGETFVMGAGADYAYGYEGNDYLYGEAGADVLFGGAGVDVMIGGADGDWFDGGEGVNYYFGGNGGGPGSGLGPDVFVARDLPGVQVIQDWTSGQGVIRFEGSGLSSLSATLARGFQNGAYYVIQIDVDTAVWINGATAASLTAADFAFVS